MTYNPEKHRRRSTRLSSWDYSWAWWYYVTIVTNNREVILGNVVDDRVQLSRFGAITQKIWLSIPKRYKNIELDSYVVMPNHVHGIIIVNDERVHPSSVVGAIHESPLRGEEYVKQRRKMLLSKIMGWFKMNSAKQINLARKASGSSVLQRSFHDHIIRNDADLHRIRTYIANNPLQWALDEENPDNRN